MNDFEREILEEVAGKREPRPWGAAVGAALEFLRSAGYVDRRHAITSEGLKALEEPK